MTIRRKLLLAAASTAVVSMGAYLIVASDQSRRQAATARAVIHSLVEGTTVDTSAAILRLIAAQDEGLRKEVDGQLNVVRDIRNQAGPLTFSKDRVRWIAENQFTHATRSVAVPKMLFGGKWLGQNANALIRTPIVDDAQALVGGTMTIFERMNPHGDMIRVATNVLKDNGDRAIGTFIPATNSDGAPNPVVKKVLGGGTYRGVAWIVNGYYVADYEPLRDGSGRIVGMLYAGEREENGIGLRSAITSATVGKTGSIIVIAATGDKKGKCLMARDIRNGSDMTYAEDALGKRYGSRILDIAPRLSAGKTAILHYSFGTRSTPSPIVARVAFYAPWGWAVVTEAHEDDFAPVFERLRNSGHATVIAFLLIGGAMLLVSLPLFWAEATERKRREAERANSAKSDFLSRMSHELRTPMNAILGFAQILQMDELSEDQADSVGHIRKAGEHLLRLINEVLDISRIEAGAMALSLEAVSIADVAAEVSLLVKPMADQRRITVTVNLGELANCHVTADRQRLLQVILNFASNAVKYNRDGGSLDIGARALSADRVRVRVSDTGPGIDADHTALLFVPFERLGADRGEVEGTGLGLALSKRLVEAMGGSIGFETGPDGTTFYVDLPATDGPMATAASAEADLASDADAAHYAQKVVLLIEDNLSNVRLVEKVLASHPGIRLLVAMQGTIGYDLALEHRPDLILMDLDLPDCHGFELLRRIKQTHSLAQTQVVVISADANDGQVARLLAAGASGYLTKPLDLKLFTRTLEMSLASDDPRAA
ncbi:MAG: Cache 3/Cache 2 fusion domain-containing protein [Fimbriimonadaceae bacterium]